MKLNVPLFRQRIGFYLKKHWQVQGKRPILDTGATKELAKRNIPVYKPEEILNSGLTCHLIEDIPNYIPKPIKLDHTHPDWHERVCYTYKDNNVLLEGLLQAQVLTKTIVLQDGLPENLNLNLQIPKINKKIKEVILNSHLFDAEQVMLPKVKDPLRPAWNFPRTYGITQSRINKLMIARLLQVVESICKPEIVNQRNIIHNLDFIFSTEKTGDLLQMELRGDTLLTSSTPLKPVTSQNTSKLNLPDIFPIKHTVTLNEDHIYQLRNIYPLKQFSSKYYPHTLFVHYDGTQVKNLFEEEVTDIQIIGRTLLKAFTTAASYARETFGQKVGDLPRPVTLQCVQTDGHMFHFGVLQLNTLNLEEEGLKNIWYQTPIIPLFNKCSYELGKPVIEGYNSDIIRHLVAFYNNV